MAENFAALTQACGGRINPETLMELFMKISDDPTNLDAQAIGEYYQFMHLGRRFFAPAPGQEEEEGG